MNMHFRLIMWCLLTSGCVVSSHPVRAQTVYYEAAVATQPNETAPPGQGTPPELDLPPVPRLVGPPPPPPRQPYSSAEELNEGPPTAPMDEYAAPLEVSPQIPGPYIGRLEYCHHPEGCFDGHFVDWSMVAERIRPSWGRIEYLQWWRQKPEAPPLVTTGGDGLLSNSQTELAFDLDREIDSSQPGGRFDVGQWTTPDCAWGVGVRYWAVANAAIDFDTSDETGQVLIARPVFEFDPSGEPGEDEVVDDLVESFIVISGEDQGSAAGGRVRLHFDTRTMGGDLYLRRRLSHSCGSRWDMLLGWEASRIDETIWISTTRNVDPPLETFDLFETRNRFMGGMIGALWHGVYNESLTIEALAKIALGNMDHQVTIGGSSTGEAPGSGLLAQPSNQGVFKSDQFAYSPEVNLNFHYHLVGGWHAALGYTLIYWSEVARPGRQIDQVVDLVPDGAPARPRFRLDTGGFWVQGVTLGLSCSY